MELEFSGQIFRKIFKRHISWKSVQWELSCSTRTDGQTDTTNLIVTFRNFAKALKNWKANTEVLRPVFLNKANGTFGHINWRFLDQMSNYRFPKKYSSRLLSIFYKICFYSPPVQKKGHEGYRRRQCELPPVPDEEDDGWEHNQTQRVGDVGQDGARGPSGRPH